LTNPPSKKVIIVTGPTASGKTAVAIQLAIHFQTEIISADSRQCYKELNIGVARPSPEALQTVPHHFIASHSISEEITAVDFEKYALKKTDQLFTDHEVVIMVGGTGLYIKAFCEGLDEIPEIDPSIRKKIMEEYTARGLVWLQNEIKEKDPAFYAVGERQNPQRMMRALEVVEATGQSINDFRKGKKQERPFAIQKIGLELTKEELQRNIDNRVEEMMKKGLLEEVRSLMPYRELNALRTVGYTELFDQLDGKCSMEKAIEDIKTHTRQYAKRQMTWFKKDGEIQWFAPGDLDGMLNAKC
jgi:tRNA dimethylallyltransferase